MAKRFIDVTIPNVQLARGCVAAENVAAFWKNATDPNGGSVVTLDGGAQFAVAETVEQIKKLLEEER